MKTFLLKTGGGVRPLMLVLCMLVSMASWGQEIYSFTPNQETTGVTSSSYITTETEFTYQGICWAINQWIPSNVQIKTNQSSPSKQFYFYNTTTFSGRIAKVVITFADMNVTNSNYLMFKGGTEAITSTSFDGNGTAGTWDSDKKTLTWIPDASESYTFFAFYQNGKAASGTNKLSASDAIVVTYEDDNSDLETSDLTLRTTALTFDLYNNNDAQTISYTTSSSGEISVISNNYVDAIVNNDNTITITPKAVTGSTQTITVMQASDGTYATGIATFTVDITDAMPSTIYEKVTDASVLNAGDKLLFVCESKNTAMGKANSTYFDGVDIPEPNNGQLSISRQEVNILTLGGSEGQWTFQETIGNNYLSITNSSKNELNSSETASENNAKWTISISEGDATITNVNYTTRAIKWNATSSRFATYTSGQTAIQLYRLPVITNVATPIFSIAGGSYDDVQSVTISCETEDATIYYTTDGTVPSSNSMVYSNAITISETTTLKAIAIKDDECSAIASATYDLPTAVANIAAAKMLDSGTRVKIDLTDAQVVYIDSDKKNIYVRDESGAIDLYNNSGFNTELTTGDILSGSIVGFFTPYKNLPEITSISDITALTATSNSTVIAKTIEGTTAAIAENLCDLVKIAGTTITSTNSKYYVGENADIQLYDNFKVGYTVEVNKSVDVSGIATVYNATYEIFPRMTTDIVYLASSEEVSITAVGYSTYASDNNLDFSSTDAIQVFYATVAGETLTFHKINKVAAGTGVLLVSANGEEVEATNVPFFTDDADATTDNVFVRGEGSSVTWSADDQKYVLFNGADGIGFYRANNNRIATNRAYVQVPAGTNVKSFAINIDEADAMSAIKAVTNNADIYDLSGRRVSHVTRGLYIVGGKKVYVK